MNKYCENVYANENIDECKIDYIIEHNGKWLPFDHTTGFNYCPWCGKKIKKYIPKVIRIKKEGEKNG